MFRELNPLLHSELRLAVMSILIGVESADFVFIRQQTGATAGNLSVQLDKLSRAGYITVERPSGARCPARSAASPMRGATPLRSMSRRCKATSDRSKAAASPTRTGPASEHTGRGRTNRALNGRAAKTVLGAERGRTNRVRNGRAAETHAERKEPHGSPRRGREGLEGPGNARKGPAGGAQHRKIRAGVYHTIHPGPNCRKGSSGKGAPDYCCAPDSASCVSF